MMPLPTYQCKIALQIVQTLAAINDVAACFPSVEEIQTIANEAIPCYLTLEQLFDIYQRLVDATLCYLQSEIGGELTVLGEDFVFDLLSYNDNLFIYNAFAGSFTFTNLETVNQSLFFSFADSTFDGGNMSFLRFISLPALTSINADLYVSRDPNLTSFSAPALLSVGRDIYLGSNASLTDVDISALTTLGRDFFASGSLINGLQLPNLTSWTGTQFLCDSIAIPTADVNALLIKFDSLAVTGTTINFAGGANGAPSGAGLTAKANLQMNNTVTTN